MFLWGSCSTGTMVRKGERTEGNPVTGGVLRVTSGAAGDIYVEALEELPAEAKERLTDPEVLEQLPAEAQERLTSEGGREGLTEGWGALWPFVVGSCRISYSPEPIIAGWRFSPRCIDDDCVFGCTRVSIRQFGLQGEYYTYTCVCGPVA
jgi:hypothetical protein